MKILKLVVWGLLVFLCSATTGAQDNATSAADAQTQKSASPAPTANKEQATQEQQKAEDLNKRSAPIETFVPSEKVSPDRSISFPVDI
jgi:hypothetical protein